MKVGPPTILKNVITSLASTSMLKLEPLSKRDFEDVSHRLDMQSAWRATGVYGKARSVIVKGDVISDPGLGAAYDVVRLKNFMRTEPGSGFWNPGKTSVSKENVRILSVDALSSRIGLVSRFDDVLLVMDRYGRAVIVDGDDLQSMFRPVLDADPKNVSFSTTPTRVFASCFAGYCFQQGLTVTRRDLREALVRARYVFDLTEAVMSSTMAVGSVNLRCTKHCSPEFVEVIREICPKLLRAADNGLHGEPENTMLTMDEWIDLASSLGEEAFYPEMISVVGTKVKTVVEPTEWGRDVA